MAVVAAACHPQHKLRWIRCLSPDAATNVDKAIKEALTVVQIDNDTQLPDEDIQNDDYFDFSVDRENPNENNDHVSCKSNGEISFEKYLTENRTDLNLLNMYPCVKTLFLRFNCPLPSSAAVERLFSYATMFNLPKFNRLTDDNFSFRVLSKCNTNMNL